MNEHGTFDARDKVLVIGLGRSGLASCAVLRSRGVTVYATDEKPQDRLHSELEAIGRAGVRFVAPDRLEQIASALTGAVLSPGIPLNGELVRRVQAGQVPVYSEIEVAYRLCAAPIVAVTGTKGKTTTTALTGALFRSAGLETRVGGNIGNPLIRETVDATPAQWVIAEVSSFQLESIRSFKPKISAILNITPDHLDRYHSMEEYAEAKFRIFANQGPSDTFVGSLDDARVGALAAGEQRKRITARALWYSRAPDRLATLYVRGERIVYAPPSGDPRPIDVMPIDEIPLLGAHNIDNVLAALLIGLATELDPEKLRLGVRAFRPLAHRLETVGELDGVTYVDDSKATNPSAAIAALGSFERPIVLIAGGRAKGTEFSEFARAARDHAKAVVLIGEAAHDIAGLLSGATVARAGSMEEAVARARGFAKSGDVVLLSPGCASFDMFESAEERGDEFVRAVRAPAKAVRG